MRLLPIALRSTADRLVDPSSPRVLGRLRTGVPVRDPPAGWDLTPGARGCTQSRLRDHHAELSALGARVRAQRNLEYQREAAGGCLPFEILSEDMALTRAMTLPTFEVAGYPDEALHADRPRWRDRARLRRCSSDRNADDVAWLKERK
jgi:hypothetical protein